MQDFEASRLDAAKEAFSQAFNEGYAEGKQLLASGQAERLPDVETIFTIDVPCNDLFDNMWHAYCPLFRDAGHRAALAERRKRDAKLDASEVREDGTTVVNENVLRWRVILNA